MAISPNLVPTLHQVCINSLTSYRYPKKPLRNDHSGQSIANKDTPTWDSAARTLVVSPQKKGACIFWSCAAYFRAKQRIHHMRPTRFRNVVEYRNMGENARGTLVYQVVRLPKTTVRELGLSKTQRCRVRGSVDGEDIALALNPDPESTHYIMLSKALLKKIKKDVGSQVVVEFELQDPNQVDIPEELQRALRGKALKTWEQLTAGKQRTWCTFVDKAKLQATRTKRVKEVIVRLESGNLDPKVPLS